MTQLKQIIIFLKYYVIEKVITVTLKRVFNKSEYKIKKKSRLLQRMFEHYILFY